jgi:XTP/dITP diphosphohydrolase
MKKKVKRNWEQLKLKEGKKSVLEGVPKSLPAVVKAIRIQEKVAGVGFDWEQPEQVWEKGTRRIIRVKRRN